MNKYQKNAIAYLKAQISVAKEFKESGNILKFNTIQNMIRENLGYCMIIGLFSHNKYTLLLQIVQRMIDR